MTTTPMKSAFALSCALSLLSTLAACEGTKGDTKKEKEAERTTSSEHLDTTAKTGGQAGQPGQAGKAGSPTSGGHEEMKVERPTDKLEGTHEQMGTDTRTPLERANARMTELEERITKAKNDAKALSRQINQDTEREVTEAKAKVKAKAEAARQATAENTSKAIQEFEAALDDLDKKIKAYEGR